MSQKKFKLLRKIALLTGRSGDYIKKEFKKMPPSLQEQYIVFVKETIRQFEEDKKKPIAAI